MTSGRIDIARLRAHCAGRRIGRTIAHFDELASTNTYLLTLPHDTDVHGLVVIGEYQSGGRGRHGSRWQCPRGAGILCTIGLADSTGIIPPGLLALQVPIALCTAIQETMGLRCVIDWPNDLMVDERKVAGTLIEAHANGAFIRYAIGLGINCLQHAGHFPQDLRSRATSLDLASDKQVDRTAVLAAVLTHLDDALAAPEGWEAAAIRDRWRSWAMGLGRRVCVIHDGQRLAGNVVDIDPTAAIVIQLDEGGRRMFDAASTTLEWVR